MNGQELSQKKDSPWGRSFFFLLGVLYEKMEKSKKIHQISLQNIILHYIITMWIIASISTALNSMPPPFARLNTFVPQMLAWIWAPIYKWVESRYGINYPDTTTNNWISYFHEKSIAVVGNAPIENKWQEIDSHDVVLRMNFGVLPNNLDPVHTWMKSDILSLWATQVIASKDIQRHIRTTWQRALFCVNSPSSDGWEMSDMHVIQRLIIWQEFLRAWNHNIALLPPDFYLWLREHLSWAPPSTWFTTLQFLIQYTNFRSLTLFGFDFSTNNRYVWNMKHATHDFQKEKEIIFWWIHDDKRISIVH